MNKKYLLLATLLSSSACLASFQDNDKNDKQIITARQLSLVNKKDDDKADPLSILLGDYINNLKANNLTNSNTHEELSNHKINPNTLKNEDWDKVYQLFNSVTEVPFLTDNPEINVLVKVTKNSTQQFNKDYWSKFVDLRNFLKKNDYRTFDLSNPKSEKLFQSMMKFFGIFISNREKIIDTLRHQFFIDSKNEDTLQLCKLMYDCEPIMQATINVYMDAYQKFNGPLLDDRGYLVAGNKKAAAFLQPNGLMEYLMYIKHYDVIKPFMFYPHTKLNDNLYQTYIPQSDISNLKAGLSLPLIRFNTNSRPTFIDEPGLVLINNRHIYSIYVYYGLQGNKGFPYALSDKISLFSEKDKKIEADAQKIIEEILSENASDIEKNTVINERVHKIAQKLSVSEKAEEIALEYLNDIEDRVTVPITFDDDMQDYMIKYVSDKLGNDQSKFIPLPKNMRDIELQDVKIKLQDIKTDYAELMKLKKQFETALIQYSQCLNSAEFESSNIIVEDMQVGLLTDDEINIKATIVEIDQDIAKCEQSINELCEKQIRLEYDEKIVREQQAVSARVAAESKQQTQPKTSSVKGKTNNNKKGNKNNNTKVKSTNSGKISSTLLTSPEIKKEVEILQLTKEKAEKIKEKVKSLADSSHLSKPLKLEKFDRVLNELIKGFYLVDGGNVDGKLNRSSHGRITLSNNDVLNSSGNDQSIGIVRSHGSVKDNKVSVAQVKNVREAMLNRINAGIKTITEKINELKNNDSNDRLK